MGVEDQKGGKNMNISSIGNSWSTISNYLKTHQTSTSGTSQSTQNALNLQNLLYSADGDSLEISGDAQNQLTSYMMYGPPPPNGANGPGPGPGSEIKDFLDKVANGTATEDDLKDMQSVLQKMRQKSDSSGVSSNTTQDSSDPIKSFLDKVANGTATVDDLTGMQSILQQAQQQSAVNNVNDDSGSTGSDPIRDFLDKVANGTVTDDDLQNMQSVLQQMRQKSDSHGAHMHRRHNSSESDSTNPSGTSLDTTSTRSAGFDLKSFLDKVADGTVTDDDLANMQTILNTKSIFSQMQQQFFNNSGDYSNLDTTNSSFAASFLE
jgi:hypothetical protein